jgi:hypothetical protein
MTGSRTSSLGGQQGDTLSRVSTQIKLRQGPEIYHYQFKIFYLYILGNSVFNNIKYIKSKTLIFVCVLKYNDIRIDIIITNRTDLGSYTIHFLDICHFL